MQHQHDHGPSPTGWWWSRMTLRLLSVVFNVAIIGFSVFYLNHWTLGPLIMMGPPAIVALLWDCVDAVCLCVFGDRRGAHPVARLVADLLLFLGLGATSGVIAFTLSKLDDSGYYFAFFQDEAGAPYLRVVLGFGVLATLAHLAMLAMACVETRRRRPAVPRACDAQSCPPHGHQPQVAPPPSDPPPAYSDPPHRDSPLRDHDRITASGRATGLAPAPDDEKAYRSTAEAGWRVVRT